MNCNKSNVRIGVWSGKVSWMKFLHWPFQHMYLTEPPKGQARALLRRGRLCLGGRDVRSSRSVSDRRSGLFVDAQRSEHFVFDRLVKWSVRGSVAWIVCGVHECDVQCRRNKKDGVAADRRPR